MNYWGPLANHKSSDWIVDAIVTVMGTPDVAPDLLLTYIPHLDYDLQRYGPGSDEAKKALDVVLGYLTRLKAACADFGYDWIFVGDYAIEPVQRGAIFPNRALREAGLFQVRDIRDMAYTDFFTSRAFAVVDHQTANVYCRDAASTEAARAVLEKLEGVAEVLDREQQAARGLAHARSGDLVIVAENGAWFAYPWFEKKEAPDYASHVDIHNKPGYDPCELFFGWPPGSVSFDTTKIRGSHGNVGPGFEIAWTSSLALDPQPQSFLDLARATQRWMEVRE
jgi:predicted AlkP superfamily pyrophosphatase or phosphodiesterase